MADKVIKLVDGKLVVEDVNDEIDGGFPDSVYTPEQCIDGGGP